MKWNALLAAFLFLATGLFASAQIQVSAETQRSNYLLFERVDVLVTITNIGGSDLILNNDEGRPWLSFMVSGETIRQNFMPVHAERQSNFNALTLKVGETKTLRVNITPLFSFREEGDYRASAVIDLPGEGQVVSEPVPFTIQKGHVIVSQSRSVESSQRTYSLVRFSPTSDLTRLYLRVEAPDENVVYANLALGDLVSSADPDFFFDPQGNVHVLQPTSLGTYLYTRADPDGKVLDQRVFKTVQYVRPRLAKIDDGSVVVQGGLEEDPNAPREKLSDTQTQIAGRSEAPPPQIPPP
jgi:hypothetical protein